MKRRRTYTNTTQKRCLARGSHDDAVLLVDYLLNLGGYSDETGETIATALRWQQRLGAARVTDMGRFHRAKNHVKDGTADDGRPCTGYRLHYRTSGRGNEWRLIDPSGSLPEHLEVAKAEILGDLQQQVAFRTVNDRRIRAAEAMADLCLKQSPQDVNGYQLMTRYGVELRQFGAASDTTIAEITVWLA